MPDISGFSQFVTDTEILHSQHIVQELLEILLDSNQLGLQVSEIEGDAIFFFKLGAKPDLQSLLKQVETMFTQFHAHLKLYEHQRICPCGACKSAVNLSLKVIAHFGEVTGLAVKDHRKLFGKDVILVHRLLKNSLDKREYVLLTDAVVANIAAKNLPHWYIPNESEEQYDVGQIQFYFSDLSELHKTIRVNFPVHNTSAKTYVAFSEEETMNVPMERIFETLLSMQRQITPMRGKRKENPTGTDAILRIGERHPCLITRNNNMNVVESVKVGTENIEMIEMSEKGIAGYRYLLKKLSPGKTQMSVQMLIRNNLFFRIGFSLGVKSKMLKRIHAFFLNLKVALSTRAGDAA